MLALEPEIKLFQKCLCFANCNFEKSIGQTCEDRWDVHRALEGQGI